MYFPESEAIARLHPDLTRMIGLVDEQIASATDQATLRPGDFAAAFHADDNQVVAVFELLVQQAVLSELQMVECKRCHNLMPADRYFEAVKDEDRFECSACSAVFSRHTMPVRVYRLAPATLARLERDLPPTPLGTQAKASDIVLSQRAQHILVAMLELNAIDSDSRRSTADFARKAFGSISDSNSLKGVMAELKEHGYVSSTTGPGGGYWLTNEGCARALKIQKIRSENSQPI